MDELVLSDPERRLISECVFVIYRLCLEGFLSERFPSEKLRDLCSRLGAFDLVAISDLFEEYKVKHGN